MKITVLIADDHAIVRDGIKAVLERKTQDIAVAGEASNGRELLESAAKLRPAVYIVDISMPLLNGIDSIQRLLKLHPDSRIIVLSMHDDRISVEKALKAGARGFVVKGSSSDEMIKAIREVHAGGFYLCSAISRYAVQEFVNKNGPLAEKPTAVLTPKEREILQFIAEGYSGKETAKKLKLSLNTVYVHRNNIMRKLDIHKQAELVRYALKEGISYL